MTSKASMARRAAKTIGAFLVTVLKNPIVFDSREFDKRRQIHK